MAHRTKENSRDGLLLWGMIISMLVFSALPVSGQSMYSAGGIGEYRYFMHGRSSGMGHVGLAVTDEIMYNMQNPAAGAFLENTCIATGFFFQGLRAAQQNSSFNSRFSRWNGMNFSVKIMKWLGIAGGLVPFSDFDFGMHLGDDGRGYVRSVQGRGGLSRGFGAVAWKMSPNISLGLAVSRYFGQLEEEFTTEFSNPFFLNTFNETKTSIYGTNFRIGCLYRHNRYSIGTFYSIGVKITGRNELTLTDQASINSTFPVKIPAQWGIGGLVQISRGVKAGVDIHKIEFNDMFIGNSIQRFKDGFKLGFGGEYIPERDLNPSLLEKMSYRAGFAFGRIYVPDIDGSSIGELSVTMGFGLPFSNDLSRIDFAVELGTRGSKGSDLVGEQFLRVSLIMGIRERWFQKSSLAEKGKKED